MENKRNLWVIPTDKPSRLYLTTHEYIFEEGYSLSTDECQNKHIYITSDEEIKEGDWFIALDGSNDIYKANKVWLDIIKENTNPSRKIILTTDQDLIADGVQPIDDEFLEWFVKNPNCEEIGVKKYENNKYWTYEKIIPKEEPKQRLEKYSERFDNKDNEIVEGIFNPETWGNRLVDDVPKQETLEEVAEKYVNSFEFGIAHPRRVCKNAFINGAKWQQERSYSEEDMNQYSDYVLMCSAEKTLKIPLPPNEWFEQFKKK